MPEQSLKEKTAKGLFWGGLSNGIQQLLNLFFGIFLARLLSPADYGTIAMLTIFSAIASSIQESGFSAALTNKQDATHQDYNAVFWFSTFAGIIMYVILFLCAPLISDFFNAPQLIPLSRFLFLGFLIASTGITHNAILFKNLQVKEKAKIDITALLISGITGVIMAYHGMSYWGIATQNVLYITCITALRWYYSPWKPDLSINLRPLRTMLKFSSKLFLTNIVNQVNSNIFSTILGKYYTASEVGFYAQGNKWMIMGQLTIGGMINSIAQPIFTQTNQDNARTIRTFRKLLRFTSFISFPALLGLAFISKELILIAIGEKWLPAVPFLQLLCISGAIWPIINLYFQMIISQGRSNIYFWTNLIFGLCQIGIAILMFRFGILWMIAVYVSGYIVSLIAWQIILHRIIGLSNRLAFIDIASYAGCAILTIFCTYLLTLPIHSIYILLPSKIVIAVLLYVAIMKISKSVIFEESMVFFLNKLKRK